VVLEEYGRNLARERAGPSQAETLKHRLGDMMRDLPANRLIHRKPRLWVTISRTTATRTLTTLQTKATQLISRYCMHLQGLYIRPTSACHTQISNAQSARPCYVSLKNNVSTSLLRTSLGAWPEGTEDFVNHQLFEDYIVSLSRVNGVDVRTHYKTRVEDVKRVGESWIVRTSSLTKLSVAGRRSLLSRHWVRPS
jgi:hypothetical protein